MDILEKLKELILDILFPAICLNCKNNLACSEKENGVCEKCLGSIQIYSSFFCPKCRSRIPNEEKSCHKEIKFLLAPATDYQNQTIKNMIWSLKYRKWQSITKIIKPLICSYLDILNYDFTDYLLIPIPLHSDRLRERGFNQSELITEMISQKTNAISSTNNLKRIKATEKQAELKNINERINNVEKCFALNDPNEVKGKNIIIVDDVFTTGSTISEAVKILKQAGAKKIIAFVFAKA
jgi:ComF family protein